MANDSTTQPSRRDFLLLAGSATAAGLAHPSVLFAQNAPAAILLPADAHPALRSAARLLAGKLGLAESAIQIYQGAPKPSPNTIAFALAPSPALPAKLAPKVDGYTVLYPAPSSVIVFGARPRSLLFAAGEPEHWLSGHSGSTPVLRNPEFAIRNATWHANKPVADQCALMGVNFFVANIRATPTLESLPEVWAQVPAAQQETLRKEAAAHKAANPAVIQEFRDADVDVYALLPYGNSFKNWSPVLYEAVLKAFPSAVGVSMPHSHEFASLCPSDPATWRVFDAFVKEWAAQTQATGLSATFWDAYGAFCQDARCKANGLDKFPDELHAFVTHYHGVLTPLGQRLHLRTWSSGCPHWLGTNYVHAPGYGQFGLTHPELWERVIKETPADVIMQTKVYHSDCEPDPRFSTLLGKCKPHTEMVEYQITGQTIGRHYFPSSTVDFTARTLKQSLALVGPNGGAQIHPDGELQLGYDIFADILNNIDVYAWRQLTWNINTDLNAMRLAWARSIYGAAAAPAMVRFIAESEEAVYRCFSPLGHGSATNSDFAGNIARRETLLRYTNRYYLPEYAAYLEPTLENVERCAKEKAACMAHIETMAKALGEAKPHLTPAQATELTTRLDWLRQFAICNTTLDLSLWRFRYLRGLAAKQTTDGSQIKELAAAYDLIEATAPKLFQYDPAAKFSCYQVAMGQVPRKPDLGNPRPLMHQIYSESLAFAYDSVGPDYLDPAWIRSQPQINIPAEKKPG